MSTAGLKIGRCDGDITDRYNYIYIYIKLIEGSLEVKLPTMDR